MPYATEAEYRAAVVAYRALHDVFYRFHRSVCGHEPLRAAGADRHHAARDAITVNEHDFGKMVGELLPALSRSYAGPPQYIDRLAETFRELGVKHAASSEEPFDALLTHQAYVDIDNILQDLMRGRERFPSVFDEAFAGGDAPPVDPDGKAS